MLSREEYHLNRATGKHFLLTHLFIKSWRLREITATRPMCGDPTTHAPDQYGCHYKRLKMLIRSYPILIDVIIRIFTYWLF